PDIGDGHTLGLILDLAPHSRDHGIRISGRADGELTAGRRRLKSVQIECGGDLLANLQIVGVSHDANDLPDVVILDFDPMPDRVRVAKEHTSHRLVEDYYFGCFWRVAGIEVPPRDQWNAQGLEVARRNPIHIDLTSRLRPWSAAFHRDGSRRSSTGYWWVPGKTG